MARPSKSVKLTAKNLSKEELDIRDMVEEKLKGNSDKIVPPKYLSADQKKIYNFIVAELEASGVLSNLDTYILETACISIDRIKEIEMKINQDFGNIINKSLMSAKDKYTKDFFRCCNELCLSPQSRAKLGNINLKAQEDAEDPLLKLLQGGKDAF